MPQINTCQSLVRRPELVNNVDLNRYRSLPPQSKRLISHWFQVAWRQIDAQPQQTFEPFIYTWFSLNGWAACVTDLDSDNQWRQALSVSPELCEMFDDLASNPESKLYKPAQDFYELWPIFRSSEIRHKNAFYEGANDRPRIIKHYFDAGIQEYEPKCLQDHWEKGEKAPLDWPHTLSVLYRVRCNLFHGEKGMNSDVDVNIVFRAFQVLANFINDANLFGLPRKRA